MHDPDHLRRLLHPMIDNKHLHDRAVGQIETGVEARRRRSHHLPPRFRRNSRRIQHRQRHPVVRRGIELFPFAVAPDEAQAQRVMMTQEMPQAFAQGVDIHAAVGVQHHGLIEMLRLCKLTLEKPALRRRQRNVSGQDALLCRVSAPAFFRDRRQFGNRLILHHLLRRDDESGLPDSRNGLNAENRIAAQFEKVLVNSNRLAPKDLPPRLRQKHFVPAARRIGQVGRSPLHRSSRFRQGAKINFAVRSERKGVKRDKEGRNRMRGQLVRQKFPQGRDQIAGRRRMFSRHIRRQLRCAVQSPRWNDHRLPDARMLPQRGFDLAEFDTEAANFDLLINPPKKFNLAGGAIAGKIAGFIDAIRSALRRAGTKRVRQKALLRQVRPIQIPPRHADAAKMQFAGDADGDGMKLRVKNIGGDIRKRSPERGRTRIIRIAFRHRRADRRFGRPVGIEQPPSPYPPRDEFPRADIAADNHDAQIWEFRVRKRGQHGGRDFEMRDPQRSQEIKKIRAGQQVVFGVQAERRP